MEELQEKYDMFNNHDKLCKYFIENNLNKFYVIKNNGDGCVYDNCSKLWDLLPRHQMIKFIMRYVENEIKKFKSVVKKSNLFTDEDKEKMRVQMNFLIKKYHQIYRCKTIFNTARKAPGIENMNFPVAEINEKIKIELEKIRLEKEAAKLKELEEFKLANPGVEIKKEEKPVEKPKRVKPKKIKKVKEEKPKPKRFKNKDKYIPKYLIRQMKSQQEQQQQQEQY